jgi:hypothetical protein
MARRTAKPKDTRTNPKPDATDEGPDAWTSAAAEETRDGHAAEGGASAKADEASDQVAAQDASAPNEAEGVDTSDAGASAPATGTERRDAPNDAGDKRREGPARREHSALCHVWRDGMLMPPGTPLLLTETEFAELKRAKAVDGAW